LNNYFEVAVHSHPPVWTSAVCIQKEWLLKMGGFPIGIKSGEDLVIWALLASKSNFSYCKLPLSNFWKEENGDDDHSFSRIPDEKDPIGHMLSSIYKDYLGPQKTWQRKYIGLWHKMRGHSFIDLNMKLKAFQEIMSSIFYNPFSKTWLFIPLLVIPGKYLKKMLTQFYQN